VNEKLKHIHAKFSLELGVISNSKELNCLKIDYLGKKGVLSSLMLSLKDLSKEERPVFGQKVNELKHIITTAIEALENNLAIQERSKKIATEVSDVSLPGRKSFLGSKHPLTAILDQMIEVLSSMGFSVQYGPDIDTDYYNFEALNFPENHPARDMQDTFYIEEKVMLRTQTSNVQVRIMEQESPPIRIIAPGRVFRNETITARSHVFFHQIEALYVDKNVTFADLIATLKMFIKRLFNNDVQLRMRPSYFPFVEPGMEVDISCLSCSGKGCRICKNSGWLEVLGAGMVHPEVLKSGGIDPEIYKGFAWGIGVERVAMLKLGVKDIRQFTENDLRMLRQFTFI
jgi:phenylalanyl-tRNA synthetase alpha chain